MPGGVGRVAEIENEVDLVIGDARADLLGALLVVEVERYGQPRGLGHELAGGVGRAEVVIGENAAVGNAELDHKFLLAVVGQESYVHL